MASQISKTQAKLVVQELAEQWGFLDRDMMDDIERFNEDYRRKIDRTFLSLETAAAHSVKTYSCFPFIIPTDNIANYKL